MCMYPKIGTFIIVDGKKRFRPFDVYFPMFHTPPGERVIITCGKCVECKQQRKNDWICRALLELQNYDKSIMITLTYNDMYNPITLVSWHLQDFLKRLRSRLYKRVDGKKVYTKVKFLACGEYGKKHDRPHYHILIFGFKPEDLRFFKLDNGIPVFKSEFIADIWKLGFVSCTEVNERTLGYVVKYIQKYSSSDEYLQRGLVPPFFRCSQGFAKSAIDISTIATEDRIYLNGKAFSTPKYLLKKLAERSEDDEDIVKRLLRKRREYRAEQVENWNAVEKEAEIKRRLLARKDRLNH